MYLKKGHIKKKIVNWTHLLRDIYFGSLNNLPFLKLLFYYTCPNFPPYALLRPSHLLLPQSIPTLLSMSVGHSYCSLTSPFPFFPSLSPPSLPSGSCQSVPCLCACDFILFISLFCSLVSSYR